MNIEIGYVSDPANLKQVARDIHLASVVGIDTETTGLDPLTKKIRLIQVATTEAVWVLDMFRLPKQAVFEILEPLLTSDKKIKILQNAKFDLKFMEVTFGNDLLFNTKMVFDTYLAAKLLDGGRNNPCDLGTLASRLLGVDLDKSFQKFNWAGELYKEAVAYSALDAAVMLPLYRVLRQALIDNKLLRVAKLEFDCLPAQAQLELNGIAVDQDAWVDIAERTKEEMFHHENLLRKYFGEDINFRSNPQIWEALSKLTGLKITSADKGHLEDLLVSYKETPDLFGRINDWRPAIMCLQGYNKLKKQFDSFGPGFLKMLHPKTGRIHPEFTQIETNTGRHSCFAPWAQVTTTYGDKAIGHIKIGDNVWTHKKRWRPVTAVLDQGVRNVYDVILCTGNVLPCTLDHKLLCSDGKWREVQEIAHGILEKMGLRQGQPTGSGSEVQNEGATDSVGCSCRNGNLLSERQKSSGTSSTGGREKSTNSPTAVCWENGTQKPYVRKGIGAAPQLEGRLRRWVRLLNTRVVGWKEALRSSHSHDGASWHQPDTERDGSSPHRFEPKEQLTGQPCLGDQKRTQEYTLLTGKGQPVCCIKEIHYRGSIQVYDISVDEDESFMTSGVFAHNCRKPNLQQIPRDSYVRAAFVAREGYMMWGADYSQIELRILAQFSKDPAYVNVFENDLDLHTDTASKVFGTALENVTSDQRGAAKVINFGVPYGMSSQRYAANLSLPLTQAEKEMKMFYDTHRGLVEWHNSQFDYFKQFNCVRSASGRMRVLDNWRYQEYECKQAAKNFPIQATSADIIKLAMTRCYRELPRDVFLNNVVHDELLNEVPEDEIDEIGPEIDRIMKESAEEFVPDIPIKVEGHKSRCWSK